MQRERPDSKLSRGDSTRLNKLRSSSVFLTSPPPDIMDSVSSLVEFSFSIESELGQWIPEDVKDSVRESLALFKSGAVALSRSALHPIVAAIESKYRTVVSDFRLSPPFQSFLKK